MSATRSSTDEGSQQEMGDGPTTNGFHVGLKGVSLVDLLQMFHSSRRSVTLQLPEGVLHIRDGEVVHAVHQNTTGEAALRKLIEVDGGGVETVGSVAAPVSVRRPLSSVLLDALVSVEESDALRAESLLDSGAESPMGASAPTRLSQLDAICARVRRGITDAACCAIIDLERGILLGFDEQLPLPEHTGEVLLDAALELFSGAPLAATEHLLPGDASGESETLELQVLHGRQLYLGRRLGQHSAILLLLPGTAAPRENLAQLRTCLLGAAS